MEKKSIIETHYVSENPDVMVKQYVYVIDSPDDFFNLFYRCIHDFVSQSMRKPTLIIMNPEDAYEYERYLLTSKLMNVDLLYKLSFENYQIFKSFDVEVGKFIIS